MQIRGMASTIIISAVGVMVCVSAGQHHAVSAQPVRVACVSGYHGQPGEDPTVMWCGDPNQIPPYTPDAPAPSLGENDPIVPLVCGVNLDCSDVDRMAAAHAKPKSSRTVRTTHSSTGATSTTVTQKTPAGSTTTRVSRSAKGVTTTSTSTTTVSK
jgi:hypothetical protein